jgi:ATP-dependent RNA helicase RhlE
VSFESLGLPEFLLKTLVSEEYLAPTPIQTLAIPRVLEGGDVIGVAQTGTGKTAAFALPIIMKLNVELPDQGNESLSKGAPQVLAIAPTRELALQVAAAFKAYAKLSPRKIRVVCVIGGEDLENQISALRRGIEVVVATPGRLLDLVERDQIRLSSITTLVLDEADKLLDLGFADELDSLLKKLPKKRQNLLFSATFSSKIEGLSSRFLTDPVRVAVEGEEPTVEKIVQRVFEVDADERRGLLQHLLSTENWNQVLVFVATRVKARNLAHKLVQAGFSAADFHGDLEQDERIEALNGFKRQTYKILVATDVAARGIDIDKLSCVVNFDLPRSPNDYVHRIGRTGRAGELGVAISFIDHDSAPHFELIEKRANIQLEREQVEGFELNGDAPRRQRGGAPIKGKRPSKKDRLREAAAQTLLDD